MHLPLTADPAAVVDLSGHGHYLQWGIVQISAANATVIVLMIIVFVLALVLPFPGSGHGTPAHRVPDTPGRTASTQDRTGTDSGSTR